MNIYKRWYYFKSKPTDLFPNLDIIEYNYEFKLLPNISIEADKNGAYSSGTIIIRVEWLFWHIPLIVKIINYNK